MVLTYCIQGFDQVLFSLKTLQSVTRFTHALLEKGELPSANSNSTCMAHSLHNPVLVGKASCTAVGYQLFWIYEETFLEKLNSWRKSLLKVYKMEGYDATFHSSILNTFITTNSCHFDLFLVSLTCSGIYTCFGSLWVLTKNMEHFSVLRIYP